MCEVGAVCPNCGQLDLDEDETSCIVFENVAYREYHCHACHARVAVDAPVAPRRRRPRVVDVPLPG